MDKPSDSVRTPLQLRTEIRAKFATQQEPDPATAANIAILNQHVDAVCESLQPVFRLLIIEMLELKRKTHTG